MSGRCGLTGNSARSPELPPRSGAGQSITGVKLWGREEAGWKRRAWARLLVGFLHQGKELGESRREKHCGVGFFFKTRETLILLCYRFCSLLENRGWPWQREERTPERGPGVALQGQLWCSDGGGDFGRQGCPVGWWGSGRGHSCGGWTGHRRPEASCVPRAGTTLLSNPGLLDCFSVCECRF